MELYTPDHFRLRQTLTEFAACRSDRTFAKRFMVLSDNAWFALNAPLSHSRTEFAGHSQWDKDSRKTKNESMLSFFLVVS